MVYRFLYVLFHGRVWSNTVSGFARSFLRLPVSLLVHRFREGQRLIWANQRSEGGIASVSGADPHGFARVRETEILVEQQPPQGVFFCDHAGLVIHKFSLRGAQ